ncbi:hypothetical protein J7K92_00045 [bacterium]|nr:hypothetical protein [bacterium]
MSVRSLVQDLNNFFFNDKLPFSEESLSLKKINIKRARKTRMLVASFAPKTSTSGSDKPEPPLPSGGTRDLPAYLLFPAKPPYGGVAGAAHVYRQPERLPRDAHTSLLSPFTSFPKSGNLLSLGKNLL